LFAYQELVARLRPDWIVAVRSGDGGLAWFLASMCDLIGHGRVIVVDHKRSPKAPDHERIHWIIGTSVDDEVVTTVHDLVGTPPNAMVILGARARARR